MKIWLKFFKPCVEPILIALGMGCIAAALIGSGLLAEGYTIYFWMWPFVAVGWIILAVLIIGLVGCGLLSVYDNLKEHYLKCKKEIEKEP